MQNVLPAWELTLYYMVTESTGTAFFLPINIVKLGPQANSKASYFSTKSYIFFFWNVILPIEFFHYNRERLPLQYNPLISHSPDNFELPFAGNKIVFRSIVNIPFLFSEKGE